MQSGLLIKLIKMVEERGSIVSKFHQICLKKKFVLEMSQETSKCKQLVSCHFMTCLKGSVWRMLLMGKVWYMLLDASLVVPPVT